MAAASDLEIVLRDCPAARIVSWLSEIVGPLGDASEAGDEAVYPTRLGTIVVTPGVGRASATSVWFQFSNPDWPTHAALARLASRALGCAVMCEPGPDYPEISPLSPVVLEISAGGERLIIPDF